MAGLQRRLAANSVAVPHKSSGRLPGASALSEMDNVSGARNPSRLLKKIYRYHVFVSCEAIGSDSRIVTALDRCCISCPVAITVIWQWKLTAAHKQLSNRPVYRGQVIHVCHR
jgi:hypothetical protein